MEHKWLHFAFEYIEMKWGHEGIFIYLFYKIQFKPDAVSLFLLKHIGKVINVPLPYLCAEDNDLVNLLSMVGKFPKNELKKMLGFAKSIAYKALLHLPAASKLIYIFFRTR